MSYRNDLDALRARHTALSNDVTARTKDLEDARRLHDDAEARAKRPILDNIRVATPCSADWTKMSGSDRVRACGACNKNVYNLSDMTRDEAESLIIENEGKLCVRYFQRSDGMILLKDCLVGIRRRRRRRVIAAGAATLLAGASAATMLFVHEQRRPASSSRTPSQQGAIADPPLHPQVRPVIPADFHAVADQ